MAATNHPPSPGLSPEARLLLGAVSVGDPERRRNEALPWIEQGLDWDALVEHARRNRVAPLLYAHLKSLGESAAPGRTMATLRADAHQTAFQSLFLTRELLALLALFESEGIPAIPYKGPVLAQALYGSFAIRAFWDLDILVHKEDVLRAKDILIGRGYLPEAAMTPQEEARLLATDCEYNFDLPDDRAHVEIHWQVLPEKGHYRFDSSYLWDCAVETEFAGATVLTIPPEELLVILAAHNGDKHTWTRLRWIADVARLIESNPSLDWDRVLRRAASIRKTQTLELGLYLANVLLGAPLPDEVRAPVMSDRRNADRAALIHGRLFRERSNMPGFRDWRGYLGWARDRVDGLDPGPARRGSFFRYLAAVLTPEWSDRNDAPVPAGFSFLHYLYRPIRLARMHRTGLLRRLR